MFPGAVFSGVHEQMVFSLGLFSHADARLFLVREPLAKEISVPRFLQRIVGFDCQELTDASPDAFAPRKLIEVRARKLCLFFNPPARARRILVFKPAVGIGDGHSMKNLRDRLDHRNRRRRN